MNPEDLLEECTLCPRMCHVNRKQGKKGYCGQSGELKAARAALHMWEEPCISGSEGSGTIFFSGCPLKCMYCQNHNIAVGSAGKGISVSRLSEIFLNLQAQGANNINLVTPTHFVPYLLQAIPKAKQQGLQIPIVYNTSGYERVETLKLLEGLVDIYLPDFKYMDEKLAREYSNAPDYSEYAKQAIAEMARQVKSCQFDRKTGLIKRGMIVRHLVLPGHTEDSKRVIQFLYETYGEKIYLSLMNQYTPMPAVKNHPLLSRRLTKREYNKVVEYALELGIKNGFVQEGKTASKSFIPEFDEEGINERNTLPGCN